MRLAIIPARGGSKRIPRKNIKMFAGRHMIAWSIKAALESDCFDRIIVSTDDQKIADVAVENGAEVPFLRPAELSGDHVATVPVINHAIKWQSDHGPTPTQVCCLYATAPFVRAPDLRAALNLLNFENCDFVFAATNFAFPIQRAFRITTTRRAELLNPEMYLARSQDLEEVYHDAGQFYWGSTNAWLEERPFFESDSVPFILPRHRVQDIDTPEDWVHAEWMKKAMASVDPD